MTQDKLKFFAIVLPGLEDLAMSEFVEKMNFHKQEYSDLKKVDGGLSFCVNEMSVGFNANHILRIPTRIIFRLTSFTARDFPKLYNKFTKISWNTFFPGKVPKVKFSASESVIFDSRKVEKTLSDAIKFYHVGSPAKLKEANKIWPFEPCVYIRVQNNIFQISIDTTGERLDKRGEKLLTTHAPIRESIAAGMYEYIKHNSNHQLKKICDPMCGSSTLIKEFLSFNRLNYTREFSYQYFPKVQVKKLREEPQDIYESAIGRDIDSDSIEAAKENTAKDENIEISEGDFFTTSISNEDLVIINPPYNKRIKTEENIHNFIDKLISRLSEQRVKESLLVFPETFKFSYDKKLYKLTSSKKIQNGGIWVKFFLFSLR